MNMNAPQEVHNEIIKKMKELTDPSEPVDLTL